MTFTSPFRRGRNLFVAALAVCAAFSFASCEKSISDNIDRDPEMQGHRNPPKGDMTITEIATSNPNFTELVEALVYVDQEMGTDLVGMFNGTDQYTVFAPTNAAFENLYDALGVDDVTEIDAALVLKVLQYHVTDGRRAYNSVVPKNGMRTIETLLPGATFSVDSMGKITAVGNMGMVTAPNVSASNGIIHVVDTVLLPIVP